MNSSLVVAMKECEHRPLLSGQFPEWADLVEYWHIDDVDCAEPHEALPLLEGKVRDLAARLAEAVESAEGLVAAEPDFAGEARKKMERHEQQLETLESISACLP